MVVNEGKMKRNKNMKLMPVGLWIGVTGLMLWIMMILNACTMHTNDLFCVIYTPVSGYGQLSETDPDLYDQIKRNNLKYMLFCET